MLPRVMMVLIVEMVFLVRIAVVVVLAIMFLVFVRMPVAIVGVVVSV